jgi:hypothetical protein
LLGNGDELKLSSIDTKPHEYPIKNEKRKLSTKRV